ncbi:TPA: antitermination protein [Escherichia coli]|nr:antitermination protein [Escherichia coli]HCO3884074.1 antitermination protein [Escherichia coli]
MNLENSLKFHFCKSSQLNDSPRSTSSETLTGTDVMAGMGMVQQRARMGFSAFMGKMGVSSNDREKAIELLTLYALSRCDKVAALRKLDADIKPQVMQVLARFAFADYSRNAGTTRKCDCCNGNKFIEAEVATMKYIGQPYLHERREKVKVLCTKCGGSGELSCACPDCKGRGKAVDQKMTAEQGVPVIGECKRCGGVGYARLPSTAAYEAISLITDAITLDTWKKSVKQFYDELIVKFDIEEAWADSQLKAITR